MFRRLIIKITIHVVRIVRKYFYLTPLHHLKISGSIYQKWVAYLAGGKRDVIVDFHGANFKIPTLDITVLPGVFTGDYERKTIEFVLQSLHPGDVFVDIGANIGLFSILAAQKVTHSGHVYAFEPEPSNFNNLISNAKLNGVSNIISAENVAVGDTAKEIVLFLRKDSIGSHSIVSKSDQHITCPQLRLDNYFKNKIDFPTMIKIDVEGYEDKVLSGMNQVLLNKPTLVIEYLHGYLKRDEKSNLAKLFTTYNFSFYISPRDIVKNLPGLSDLPHNHGNLIFTDNTDWQTKGLF